MPSKTFQPLLFDSFAYHLPDSTYIDHYRGRTNRAPGTILGQKKCTCGFNSKRKLTQKQKMTLLSQRGRRPSSVGGCICNLNNNNYYYNTPSPCCPSEQSLVKNCSVLKIILNIKSNRVLFIYFYIFE
jgi:hypothetical protein